jgi:hypothetical protein
MEVIMFAGDKRPLDKALQQKIETRAYEIWESENCPNERHIEHWLRAEAEIIPQKSTPTLDRIAPAKIKQRTKSRRRQLPAQTRSLIA